MVFELMADAFVTVRAVSAVPDQSEGFPTAQELGNLFHNVPRQLWALDHPVGSALPMPTTAVEILQRIRD